MDEYEEKMKELTAAVEKHLVVYRGLISEKEGKTLFETFQKSWKAYLDTKK